MKKILLALLFAISLTGCEWMNQDVKEFFKEYTETAAGEINEIQTYYIKDSEGYFNVPSDRDCSILCYLRNPQKYYFGDKTSETVGSNVSVVFNGKDDEFCAFLLSSYPVKIEQKLETTEVIKMIISSEFLNYIENYYNTESEVQLSDTKDISFTYKMVEPGSGRTFDGTSIKIRANSEPMAVKNLTVMETDEDNPKYVLAFNMPDMSGIHKDIDLITIESNTENRSFTVTPEKDSSKTGIDFAGNGSVFVTSSEGIKATEEGNSFAGALSPRVVYFKSKEVVSNYNDENPCVFTVTLKDNIGLKSESSVSAFSLRLKNVFTDPQDLSSLVTDEDGDGYSHFKVVAPQDTTYTYRNENTGYEVVRTVDPSKVTVYYIVYDAQGKVVKLGSDFNDVDVALGSGKWSIEAWAHYPGFIDSETFTTDAKATGAVFVNQEYKGDISDGARITPFKSFEDAFVQIVKSGFTETRIVLLSDYILEEGKSFKFSQYGYSGKLVIDGKSSYSIKKTDYAAENGDWDIEVEDGSNITLLNSLVDAGRVHVSKNGTLILSGAAKPECIGLAEDAKIFVETLTERTDSSVKICSDVETPKYGSKMIFANGDGALSEDTVNSFYLSLDGYFINPEKNDFGGYEGVVRVSGISVKVPSYDGLFVMLYKKNDSAEESSFGSGAVLKAGEKIYARVCKYNENSGNYAPISDQDITSIGLYDSGFAVDSCSYDDETGYTVPAVKVAGSYTIEVHFKKDMLEFSAQTTVKVEEE